jgi:hypothetical protein
MVNFQIDFEAKLKAAKSASGVGYPTQISASDLMSNFNMAALDADATLVDTTTVGAYIQRKLRIPAVPQSGTFVLGAVDGSLSWLSTEEC